VIYSIAVSVDGLVDVGEWFVAGGKHDGDSPAPLDDAGMLLGRKTYEGQASFWPTQSGKWAEKINWMPKFVASPTLQDPPEWTQCGSKLMRSTA
jgi:hypothetical protein